MHEWWIGRRTFLGVCVLLAASCGSGGDSSSSAGAVSPVRLGAMVYRTDFTEAEWDVLVHEYDLILGLTNHGYDFPGPIDTYRARNGRATVLTYVEAAGIQPDDVLDDRFPELDLEEEAFFHTADPASLRVLATPDGIRVFFFRDARSTQISATYEPPGVLEYFVQRSDKLQGPYSDVLGPILEDGRTYYGALDPTGTSGHFYRIRTRLADGTRVAYSWTAQPEPSSSAIAMGWIEGGVFHAVLHDDALLAAVPDEVVLEVDWNTNRIFGEQGERYPGGTIWPLGEDLYEITGAAPAVFHSLRRAYRFALANDPTVTSPPMDEAYSHDRYNNRLVTAQFGAHQLKPGHPLVHDTHVRRFRDALTAGYDGLRLDFTYDTLSPSWISYAEASPQEQAELDAYVDSMTALLDAVQSDMPAAPVTINGLFVPEDEDSFFGYLGNVSGGDVEYFAFGQNPGATEVNPSSFEALAGLWSTAHVEGKMATAIVESDERNPIARLKALALYLIVAHENAYFCYISDSSAWPVEHYPEWSVPLGAPSLWTVSDFALLWDPRGTALMSREFENGSVFFNWDDVPVQVDLETTHYLLSAQGGRSPLAGGSGQAFYTAVSELSIGPRSGAIVVNVAPIP